MTDTHHPGADNPWIYGQDDSSPSIESSNPQAGIYGKFQMELLSSVCLRQCLSRQKQSCLHLTKSIADTYSSGFSLRLYIWWKFSNTSTIFHFILQGKKGRPGDDGAVGQKGQKVRICEKSTTFSQQVGSSEISPASSYLYQQKINIPSIYGKHLMSC